MRIRLLGPLEITADGVAVDLGGPRQQRVAACLIAASPRALSVDRLIDEVWGDRPPATAPHVISTYVSNLRKVFGERIASENGRHRIDLLDDDVDVVRFTYLLERGRDHLDSDPAKARLLLDEAVEIWDGRPLSGLGDESPLLRLWCEQLEELRLQAIESRVAAQLELGEHDQVIVELQLLVRQYPYRERLSAHLMLALYRNGRQAEALRVAHRLRDTLLEESGLSPSDEIEELEERILLRDPGLLTGATQPPLEIPEFLTSFIGRRVELGQLAKALETHRLVTLTGHGGIGKTRLAYEAAERLQTRFADGVRTIDVALIDDPEMFLPEVARSFGVAEQAGISLTDTLANALTTKQILLICDNCEHLVEAVAATIADLLRATKQLTVLTTSRAPLQVAGEARIEVPPMSMPSEESTLEPDELQMADAIRLFVDRAVALRPSFELNSETAGPVVRICGRLDGLPLAIEMAAGRLHVLSVGQIAELLEERIATLERFERDSVARHQTLRDVFAWSFDLLSGSAQRLLLELSVFTAEFNLTDATAVVGESMSQAELADELRELIESSLLMTGSHAGAEVRYRMLQTIREFALEGLHDSGRSGEAFDRHADYYFTLLQQAGESTSAPEFKNWMPRIREAYAEVQQALEWSLSHHPRAHTLRAARALREYWQRSGQASESARWAPRFLDESEAAPPGYRADAFNSQSFSHTLAGRFEEARAAGLEAAQLAAEAGDNRRLVTSLFYAAQAALSLGDAETLYDVAHRALDICEAAGDRWQRVKPLTVLAFAEFFGTRNLEEARDLFQEALPIYRELGDIGSMVLMSLGPLCTLCLRMGDVEAAESYGRQAVAAGGDGWQASALACLGEVYVATGDLDRAETLERRALSTALDTGLELWFRIAIRNLALIAAHRDELELAARLHGASLPNMPQFGMDPAVYEPIESHGRSVLGDVSFERLSEAGKRMTHQEIHELIVQ